MHFSTFDSATYIRRRQALKERVGQGVILLLGNNESPMNFKDNTYRFRQDSTFLYYFGLDVGGLAALIDVDSGEEIIFGTELTIDDVVWTGPLPTVAEMSASVGVHRTLEYTQLPSHLQKIASQQRKVHYIPPYRHDHMLFLSDCWSISVAEVKNNVSMPLVHAIISQRNIKEPIEIRELHKAANLTADMHLAAMTHTRAGMKEYDIVSRVHSTAISGGGELSFPIILTVNGETLHNHYHGNVVKDGQMILCDAGAETDMHYAGDMTCTYPVGRTFTQKQKDIYAIVLSTHEQAVQMLRPGITYKDIYLRACENIFSGLKMLGLTKGDPGEAVAAGAHAMFFQCGLGHMLGLDVHDMENLGEVYVGYDAQTQKSTQFGMKSLRLGRHLASGFVLTVEPGIYFIPTLIDMWKAEGKFKDFIVYDQLESYRDFSGIRIEEDFVITDTGSTLLGRSLPKTVVEIESLRQQVLGG